MQEYNIGFSQPLILAQVTELIAMGLHFMVADP